MNARSGSSYVAMGLCAALTLAMAPRAARAEVRHEGDWSDDDEEVTLDLDGVPRAEALNRLAAAAGWNIVVHAPKDDRVSVHVHDQPAGRVLDLLLTDARYVAQRDGDMISITPDDGPSGAMPAVPPVPPIPPIPPVPAIPSVRFDTDDDGHDRTVTGGNLRIDKDDTAHDVSVLGGNVDVYGTVTGDLAVMGGNATVHRGARVLGDAAAIGGSLTLESGSEVEGDVGVLGGSLRREPGARIGGEVHDGVGRPRHRHHHHEGHVVTVTTSGTDTKTKAETKPEKVAKAAAEADGKRHEPGRVRGWASRAADAVNLGALLFVFGAVLLALAPDRMERLKVQIAARPMRSFATGVVSLIAGVVLFVATCVTVVGIPFAIVGVLAAVAATLAGVISALETVGGALLAHRTKNPYVHLAFGALTFLIASHLPVVGPIVVLVTLLTAFGSVVATRAAGLVPERTRGASPYREAEAV
jgi:hypothetical protein